MDKKLILEAAKRKISVDELAAFNDYFIGAALRNLSSGEVMDACQVALDLVSKERL